MGDNFNPGFDREKQAFIDLANRGDGLTPINYLYAGDASFESVLASYLKGGTFDINILFVNTIEAEKINTFYLNAEVAYVTLAYVKDLHISNIYVDKIIADTVIVDKELIVGREDHQRATADFYTTNFTVDNSKKFSVTSDITEFSTRLFAITGEHFVDSLITIGVGSINIVAAANISAVAPVISFDALGSFSINYFSSSTPAGLVSIYSGSSITMSAPTMYIGTQGTGWATSKEIRCYTGNFFISTIENFDLYVYGNMTVDVTDWVKIDVNQSMTIDVTDWIKIRSFDDIDILSLKDMKIETYGNMNIEANNLDIALTDSFSMSATKEATIFAEDFLLTGYKKIELKTNVTDGIVNIECSKADFTAENNMLLKGMKELNLFSKEKLSLVGHELVYLSSLEKASLTVGRSLISLTSNNPGNDTVKIEAQYLKLNAIEDINIQSENVDFTITNDVNINSNQVKITGNLKVYGIVNTEKSITFNNITFESNGIGTYTWPSSATPPTPIPILANATLLAGIPPVVVPVTGVIKFTIPNVLTVIGGHISKVNYAVIVTCI